MKPVMSHVEERCQTYKFLAECFYIPNAARMEMLRSFNDRAPGIYGELKPYIPGPAGLQEYIVEFSKLFVGPLNILAPPYGSIYLEGRNKLMGESTSDVMKWYESEHLDLMINDVADHVAFELEFMYHLAVEELKAAHTIDEGTSEYYHQKQRSFLELHLGSWIIPFSEKMEEAAKTGFYKQLAKCTREFVKQDEIWLCQESQPHLN